MVHNTGYVVSAVYRKTGLSHEVIGYLKEAARENTAIDLIAVILRLNHPTLGKASKFWERHGFKRLEYTLDTEWKASPDAEDSGGVIYTIETSV